MKAFSEFRALLSSDGVGRKASSGAKGLGKSKDGAKSEEKVPLAGFMKHSWDSQPARATAIITWAKRFDGKSSLKPGEMATYWKKSGPKKPANPSQVCIDAEKKGWIESVGGNYSVVGHGEQMVDEIAGTG
jgi:hypothetical protein